MKQRVTFTLDPKVSHGAKVVARKRGMSVSALVQSLLEGEIGEKPESATSAPFSERWAGKMKLSSKRDTRSKHLKEKYGL